MTHLSPKRNMVPKAALMRSGLVSLTTARPVNTAQPRTTLNSARLERISKKRTKNKAKTTKPDTEWKSVEKDKVKSKPKFEKVNPRPQDFPVMLQTMKQSPKPDYIYTKLMTLKLDSLVRKNIATQPNDVLTRNIPDSTCYNVRSR
ncbi:hypothetical protein Tco_0554040 [Tanacetum coccineum]